MNRLPIRVIPLLQVKGPKLVKGVQLEGLRVLGDPQAFATHYYQQGADELVVLDIVASLYRRNNLTEVLRHTTETVFVPVAAGGGVRSAADALGLLRQGADKVLINTAAVARPTLLSEVAAAIGCQSVVLYVEAKRRDRGWEAMTDNGRERSGKNVVDWVQQAVELGAGEVLLLSVDQDGTGRGFDLDLISAVAGKMTVPLIAAGGAGRLEHIIKAVQAGADAVALSSLLHYRAMGQVETSAFVGGNQVFLDELRQRGTPLQGSTIKAVKEGIRIAGLPVRETRATC